MIGRFVVGALLVAAPALPHYAGITVDRKYVQTGGRTYVEVVMHSTAPEELDVALWTPNHSDVAPALVDDRRCDNATACHARFEISGQTQMHKPVCPGASVTADATHVGWWGFVRTKLLSDRFSVC
jgi:hypothetical protein